MVKYEPGDVPITNIHATGGAGGTSAVFEDLGLLGRTSDDLSEETLSVALQGHRYLVNPHVLASALLDPVGVAQFEGAMLGALDGPLGLTAIGMALELRSAVLIAAEIAYREVDELSSEFIADVEWMIGYSQPLVVPLLLASLAGVDVVLETHRTHGGAQPSAILTEFIAQHPGLVDLTMNAAPGTLSHEQGFPVNLQQAAAELGALYEDGRPVLSHSFDPIQTDDDVSPPVRFPEIDQDPEATRVPSNIGDIMACLDHRNSTSSHRINVKNETGKTISQSMNDGPNIDVRKISHSDGSTSWIVDVPGTRVWDLPGKETNINNMGSNLTGMSGLETSLQKSLELAMKDAGVQTSEKVLLVGHSQGGIIAANAAADWVRAGKFNVTNVITAGSPVGLVDMPSSVAVLSLENSSDIVAHLDGCSNPTTSNWTTVTFDHQTNDISGNHDIGKNGYTGVAQQLSDPDNPASRDPSVARFNSSLSENGYFDGTAVETRQYRATRATD